MIPAIGYVTAEKLYKTPGVPIGLIMSNRGGTNIDVWVSEEVLASREEYISLTEKYSSELAEYTANPDTYDSNNGKKIPTSFYNNMIYPIQPYTVKGALWHQGCNNADGDQELHKFLFHDLTDSRRRGFNNPDMPFITFQLAPYTNSAFKTMRQTQFKLAQTLDNVYLISMGKRSYTYTSKDAETGAIHPYRKSPLGLRAAHTALCRVYGNKSRGDEYSSSIPQKFTVNGSEMLLTFSHTGSGLAADTAMFKNLTGFEISKDGINYLPAEAKITADGKTVRLQYAQIASPKTVRYAYADFLIEYADGTYSQSYDSSKTVLRTTLGGNLTNSAGYPAPAFTLDLSYSKVSARFYKSLVSDETEIVSFNPKYDKIIANIQSGVDFDETQNITAVSAVYKNGLLDEIKTTGTLKANTDINMEFGPFDTSAIYEMKVFFLGYQNTQVFLQRIYSRRLSSANKRAEFQQCFYNNI